MSLGETNDTFTTVEAPKSGAAGHDVYATPQLETKPGDDIPVWFEDIAGETRDVGGGVKRYDASALSVFDSRVTEQAVLTLGSDGTKWKVVQRDKLQSLKGPSGCDAEVRMELRLERKRKG